ncbi:MAG: beta-ketoacyl-[acyl-carrier-protein] synthase II [Zetaproteobacteria bacterium]|nr:beta-ketoacyl-[acyl-carrier-protein] synthase II [Pseudobdellovibrionaceae bacterium]
MRRVVITGLGTISPVGNDVETSWSNVLNGKSGIDRITSFDTSDLNIKIAGEVKNFNPTLFFNKKEQRIFPRFVQLSIAATKEALADSNLKLEMKNPRVGCAIGVGIGCIGSITQTHKAFLNKGQKSVSPYFVPSVIANMAAGNTANYFKLHGPNICTTTACTSGTHAISDAWFYIKNNIADVMICGGSEAALCELTVSGFANMKALSKNNEKPREASRPFDKDRDGFVMSEGAGILILEEYEKARERGAKIYAELAGVGMSCDAHHITSPSPMGEGAQRCMTTALHSAFIDYQCIDYINAHGTSTRFNDFTESQAIREVFKSHADLLAVSSTKGATGHCLGAAGGIEAVFLAKTIAEQIAPPTTNLVNPDPECTLDYIPGSKREMEIRYGLSNSFGFGGTNGSLILKRYT